MNLTINPIGQKMIFAYEIVAPVVPGELDKEGNPILNKHGFLFWAKISGEHAERTERIIVCLSGFTDEELEKRTKAADAHLESAGNRQ